MNGPQEAKLADMLETVKEIEFWVKQIAKKLGANKVEKLTEAEAKEAFKSE